MVSANRWLGCIKTSRLSWYLTAVSANHASSNSALADKGGYDWHGCDFNFRSRLLYSEKSHITGELVNMKVSYKL